MKLLDADKLIEFINTHLNENDYKEIYMDSEHLKDLLFFISTNSREYPTTSDTNSGFLKGNCESCFYAINGEQHTGIPCNDCDKFANKWTPKPDVKKSCENCGNNNSGYCPIAHTCGTIKDEPDKWTPIVDKVEGEKTND